MRLLLIEDEEEIASAIRLGLQRAGHQVDWEADGAAGFETAREGQYAAILLDVMLPGMDGWNICRRLRAAGNTTPILMLTARDDVDDRVKGLELGADDYLPKPFAFSELRARVQALLRRDRLHKGRVVRVADLEVDTQAKQVRRGGKDVVLTPREYALLEALVTHVGQIFSKERIQERVWGDTDSYSNTVEVHVAALRRKVDGDERAVRLIHTVHRQGYVLRDPAAGED